MTGWEELVTTALLGTDRRPLPEGLPAPVAALAAAERDPGHAVLAAAAGLSAYRHAGRLPPACPPPPPAPRQRLDPAPEAAHVLLGRLLGAGDVELVDAWLGACALRGLGVRPGLWCRLGAASERRGADRLLVGSVLGERGRAFLALHPRWRVVAAAWDETGPGVTRRGPPAASGPPGGTDRDAGRAAQLRSAQALIDRCFDVPARPTEELP